MTKLSRIVLGAVVLTALTPALSTPALAATPAAATSSTAQAALVPSNPFGLCRIWPKFCGQSAPSLALAHLTR